MVAAHDGRVLAAGRKFDPFIGWLGSLGPHTRRMDRLDKWWELPITVIVDDGDGYRAVYAHFNAVSVKPGQLIRAGQQIGWEGATGFATGCHVHFGLVQHARDEAVRAPPGCPCPDEVPALGDRPDRSARSSCRPSPPGKTVGPVPVAVAGRIPGVEPDADPDADIDPDPVTGASA